MCAASEHDQHNRTARLDELLNILLLAARQTQPVPVTVLAAQHHVLTHGGYDDIGLAGHGKRLLAVGLLAGVDHAVYYLPVPGPLVTILTVFGFKRLGPVTAA